MKIQEGTQPDWVMIAQKWCKLNNAELLFINNDSFGCWKDNMPLHIYADELASMLS